MMTYNELYHELKKAFNILKIKIGNILHIDKIVTFIANTLNKEE